MEIVKLKVNELTPYARIDYKKCDDFEFSEWIKFQKYADDYL